MWIVILILLVFVVVVGWVAYVTGRASGFSAAYALSTRHRLSLRDQFTRIIAELELAEQERGVDYTEEKKLLHKIMDS